MQFIIAAVGHKMPDWVASGFEQYTKRMPPECRVVLKEIKPVVRTGEHGAQVAMAQEAARITAALPKGVRIVVLDEHGRDLTSVALAERFEAWKGGGRDVALVIGGADGLDATFKSRADEQIRISSLTLPHGMVRLLLAEALYRAWTLTQNHPYHRA